MTHKEKKEPQEEFKSSKSAAKRNASSGMPPENKIESSTRQPRKDSSCLKCIKKGKDEARKIVDKKKELTRKGCKKSCACLNCKDQRKEENRESSDKKGESEKRDSKKNCACLTCTGQKKGDGGNSSDKNEKERKKQSMEIANIRKNSNAEPSGKNDSSAKTENTKCEVPSSWSEFGNQECIQELFLERVNAIRRSLYLPSLKLNELLNKCAAEHNYDQAFNWGCCSHIGTDGSNLKDRLEKVGYDYKWATENVSHRKGRVACVMRRLMKYSVSRKNILCEGAEEMGIHGGIGRDGEWYWTQVLCARKD